MKCPYCDFGDSRVVDSRIVQRESAVRRRRECLKCQRRFTTYEYVVNHPIYIIKSDSRREEFDRQKVQRSIQIACNKRPVSLQQIEKVVMEIEREVENMGVAEVSSKVIGELVMKHLRHLDEIAYIRFASVYREFQDVEEFKIQVEKLGS
jgi:transcriptional repressor NrdR